MKGRDGSALKEWLKNNKHVKSVTRDRASAYAKVIREELPDALQIADRFHLHQNLLEAVKKALSTSIPQTVKVLQKGEGWKQDNTTGIAEEEPLSEDNGKKTEPIVDNFTPTEENRLQVIKKVQEMLKLGFSYADIAKETGISTRTVARYRTGNPKMMCRQEKPGRENVLDCFKDEILTLMHNGYNPSGVFHQLIKKGHDVHKSTVTRYVRKLAKEEGIDICKYHKGPTSVQKEKYRSHLQTALIKKTDIQKYLWMHEELNIEMKSLYEKFPIIYQLKKCIAEFREVLYKKNMPLLYVFIDNYKNCTIPTIKSFALGLERDIAAIENAVSSERSNGFVEGNNNRVKVIKRVMYGRCGIKLLTAKIMLGKQKNG